MRDMVIVTGVAIIAVAIGGYFFLQSNGVSYTPPPTNSSVAAVVVPFTEIAQGTRSTVSTRANYLITSSSELEKLWTMIDAKGKPPAVDFASSSVIAAFAGEEPSSGYDISIEKVEDASVRTVVVALTAPGTGCVSAQVVTTPYILAEVPRTSLPFTHQDIATTTTCRR